RVIAALVLKRYKIVLRQKIIILAVFFVLVAPVAAYIEQFGFGFWSEPSEWSELGGYIGGIYTPILTILTLLILSVQIYLQVIQHRQNLIVHQEKQLDDYIKELNCELDIEVQKGLTLRNYLNEIFRDVDLKSVNQLDPGVLFGINEKHYKLFSMWCGATGCLKAMKNYSTFKNLESAHYLVQKNRVIAYLNPQVCRTLDKFNYALTMHSRSKGVDVKIDINLYEFWNASAGK
ncbi:hypothetical protein, partial [Aliivibrio fischeri]|uniref:hypothetical protein n=1 Tax=Aliivibrio fischeri TaxID=668 RepID=UPI0018C6815A